MTDRGAALAPPVRALCIVLTACALLLSVNQLFNLQLAGVVLIEQRYLFLLAAVFLCLTFLVFPAWEGAKGRLPWYDVVAAAVATGLAGYFAWTADTSLDEGWEYAAPEVAVWASIALWVLILEATRRAGGWLIFAVVFAFSLYPTVADKMPGPISGFAQPFTDAVAFHIISSESSFGIPMRAFGNLVIGFIVFGVALQLTGGGAFFNNLAMALVGGFRGGAAKVAIFASGFMGSMSGSVISNVLTTGAISIPAMRKTGFPARYAAGTEACASTGGVLMPPVMGTTAFVMASFLGRPYFEIAMAAAVPSLLYYFGLFVQIDAFAARNGLAGVERAERPSIRETLKDGWYYLFVFALLIVLLLVMRRETLAPYYATVVLLVINQFSSAHRLNVKRAWALLFSVGKSLAELVALLLGIGLIVGAFSATGLAGTLVNDLVFMAGGSTIMLLIMGAVTSFIFGMGMTVTACYIFLAVVLAPALENAGLNQLAIHLFILYWGMVSYITPPVALGAFAAATLARTNAMGAGLEAMRLGSIIYFVPFFFVLNPALIGVGTPYEVITSVVAALVGVWLLGSGMQGYIAGAGPLPAGAMGLTGRVMLVVAGLAFAAPGGMVAGLGRGALLGAGVVLAAPVVGWAWRAREKRRPADQAVPGAGH